VSPGNAANTKHRFLISPQLRIKFIFIPIATAPSVANFRADYLVTCACGSRQPIAHGEPGWEGWDTTYKNLLAPLGCEPTVWAECLFADPVGDIAVLGEPDSQELSEQCDAYHELMAAVTPLRITEPGTKAWLLSLEGVWFRCGVRRLPKFWMLVLTDLEGGFAGGMSGSPVVSADGAAIGVACTGGEDGAGTPAAWQGPNPSLVRNLPGWLLAECRRQPT
jgi:hypothetical protein